jgi:hypothetical protein
MAVDLGKVERDAPHMVSLVKNVGVILDKKGLDPTRFKAGVIGTFDHSGSTEMGRNRLYTGGTMQEVADICFAAGLTFDDDGEVPMSLFANEVSSLGDMNLGNCKGFMGQHSRFHMGATDYMSALRWIVETAGFGHVDLGRPSSGKRGLFHKGGGDALTAKATAEYPTYALFVTDGEPNQGTEPAIVAYLTAMSQLPIFVQFVGVGEHNFQFLQELDDLDGRLVDNADFFDAKDANHDQAKMLELMLVEFPGYYAAARKAGLIK